MNMFKRGRKAKEQSDPFDTMINGVETKTTKLSWRRGGKNVVVDDKPALDLNTALPGSDDFRTSLIMPGLSARFSMLREQDDPHSKLGKASDDSVLFPKRASRLNLFGHSTFALSDIAEVESIRLSIKAPFAERERSASFGDGYDSDGGSMMTRARPGEGNILFGGRQKLYRIPTGSSRNLVEGENNGSMGGKHMYESDVSLSLFQQYRQRERDAQRLDGTQPSTPYDDSDAGHSPTLGNEFSMKRGTQSSTASARSNLRSSTAATSVTSETTTYPTSVPLSSSTENTPATMSTPRKYREESSKPMQPLSQSKSAANIREKYRPAGIYSASALRGASPSSAGAVQPLDFGFGDNKAGSAPTHRTNSPAQRPSFEGNSVLAGSIRASDRGKATALGLFNKPAKEFDEQQYLQRQLQMHEGRSSPFQSSSRSQSRASSEAQRVQRQDSAARTTPSPVPRDNPHLPHVPPVPAVAGSPPRKSERASKASNVSSGGHTPPPRPRSKSTASSTAKDNVKARVESLIRRQNAELALLESQKLGGTRPPEERQPTPDNKNVSSTFLHDEDDDDDDEDDSSSIEARRPTMVRQSTTDSLRLPDGDIHPAFRSSFATSTTGSQYSKTRSMIDDGKDDGEGARGHVSNIDSETPGTQPSLGLSGLIRSHLRHDSEKSIGAPSRSSLPTSSSTNEFVSTTTSAIDNSLLSPGHVTAGPPTPTTAMSQRAQQMLNQAMALKAAAGQTSPSTPADDASDYGDDENQDLKSSSHQRGDSSATTKERREFDEDLAERRRRIRETLKSVGESDQSSGPAAPKGREYTLQAFAHADDSFGGVSQPSAPRQYRLNSAEANAVTRDNNTPTPALANTKQRSSPDLHMQNGRTAPSQQRYAAVSYRYDHDISRESTPPGADRAGRSRSNSTAVDRSKNQSSIRTGPSPSLASPYSPTSTHPAAAYNHNRSGSPQESRGRSGSTLGGRRQIGPPAPLSELNINVSRPAPISSSSPFIDHHSNPPQPSSNGRTTPNSSSRSTSQSGRKRSGTKTQISSPTFISSTSSVPLIPLPQGLSSPPPPPLPEMNPRRRGNTGNEKQLPMLNLNLSNSIRSPLETVPASPRLPEHDSNPKVDDPANSRLRGRLRKSSSEGGNLAATARQQAILAEFNREKSLAPKGPMFPNRSTTALGLSQEGEMF